MNETWKNVNMCAVYVYTLAGAKVRSLVLCSRCNERVQRSECIPTVILTHSSTASLAKHWSFSVFANYLILDIKEKKTYAVTTSSDWISSSMFKVVCSPLCNQPRGPWELQCLLISFQALTFSTQDTKALMESIWSPLGFLRWALSDDRLLVFSSSL